MPCGVGWGIEVGQRSERQSASAQARARAPMVSLPRRPRRKLPFASPLPGAPWLRPPQAICAPAALATPSIFITNSRRHPSRAEKKAGSPQPPPPAPFPTPLSAPATLIAQMMSVRDALFDVMFDDENPYGINRTAVLVDIVHGGPRTPPTHAHALTCAPRASPPCTVAVASRARAASERSRATLYAPRPALNSTTYTLQPGKPPYLPPTHTHTDTHTPTTPQ